MGIDRGLSLDGVLYLADVINNPTQKPDWMQWGFILGQMTGSYNMVNFLTGFKGLERFVFQGKNWTIGGMAFDGILRTDHTSRVRSTNYPVQTGVTMTDHAIVEPAELSIDIMMTNTANSILHDSQAMNNLQSYVVHGANTMIGKVAGSAISIAMGADKVIKAGLLGEKAKKNYKGMFDWLKTEVDNPATIATIGEERSRNAWQALKNMQLDRQPLTVVTRLQTYENMIIEELSAPDDYQTLNALKCTVHLKQILFANVAEVKTSARAAATKQATSSGQEPVTALDDNRTGLEALTGWGAARK